MNILRVHCSILVIHRSLKVKIFLGSFSIEFYPWLFTTPPLCIHFGLGRKFCPRSETIRADTVSSHILKVIFFCGLQKLREIIGLKLGKKITLL